MLRLLGIALIVICVGCLVIFHSEIKRFSDTFLSSREGQEMLNEGDYAGAIALYEEKVEADPGNYSLSMALASLYGLHRQRDKAIELYRTLMAKYPDSPEHTAIVIAYGRMQENLPEKRNNVISLYRKALRSDSDNPDLLSALGTVYLKAGDNPNETRQEMKSWLYEWAIYYYRLALAFDSKQEGTRFNLGVAYQQTERYEKAASSYCNALVLNPNAFEARFNLGLTLVNLDALEQGYQQLARSVSILSDAGRVPEAQRLAERVQEVKTMVYNDSSNSGLQSEMDESTLSKFMSPACLI
ncbi:MAG: tetratricopeptide repeat protein [Vampirovibrionales bacterium]|nr:tetratricopeptide repeat protein [Vampirovibrionales bacterium]